MGAADSAEGGWGFQGVLYENRYKKVSGSVFTIFCIYS